MAVQMQRMVVRALVDELQAVAPAPHEGRRFGIRIRLAVDRPGLHGAMPAEPRFEHERQEYRRRRCTVRGLRSRKLLMARDEIGRLLPASRAAPVLVFDSHRHAERLDVLANLAEYPDAGV